MCLCFIKVNRSNHHPFSLFQPFDTVLGVDEEGGDRGITDDGQRALKSQGNKVAITVSDLVLRGIFHQGDLI